MRPTNGGRKRSAPVIPLVVAAFLAGGIGGCDSETILPQQPPYDLVFEGDDSFREPFEGRTIRAALVRVDADSIVDEGQTTVSVSGHRAFTLAFPDSFLGDVEYEIRYWIDADGDAVCDEPATDHQRAIPFLGPHNHITVTATYRPELSDDVCATFAAP